MKGQAKRFVNHRGETYEKQGPGGDSGHRGDSGDHGDTGDRGDSGDSQERTGDNVGFLGLWRYATWGESLVTLLAVMFAWSASLGVVAAVAIYGELTALFVVRHKADATTDHATILRLFNGGRYLPAGNRSLHMDALVEDSIAFAWASVAVMAVQFSTSAIAVTLAGSAGGRLVARLRQKLLRAVLTQEVAFFDTNTSMNFASAVTEDMDKLRAGLGEHVAQSAYIAGTVVACVSVAMFYGWQLTLVGLAFVPVSIIVAVIVSKYQTRFAGAEVRLGGAAGRVVEQALANIRTVRAYAGEQQEVDRYASALRVAGVPRAARGRWAGLGAGAGWLLTYAMSAAVFAYGAELCTRDMTLPPDQQEYHPGVMVTVLLCTFMAAQNVAMCHPHLEILSAARGAARSLYRLLERRSRIDGMSDKGIKPHNFRGDIVFDNVYFNYPSRPDVKVLRGFTLTVKAGETVALVGGSGCGKSTLLQLLQRLYDADSGRVAVDGHRIQDLNLHHYRTSIGVVGQEPVLFSGTIRENIALGIDHATQEEIVAAAKIANAHQFITKLANGYDTMLGERGASLSGGQRQRVALARALLRQPALLVLDEPTAALDPAAERCVQAALDAAAKGRTTLVVSHRLSTIASASRIVVVEQGAVLEQGTHRELLERRGAYWAMVQQDLTTRSIATTLSPHEEDKEEEDTVERDVTHRFQRAFSTQSNSRASLSHRGSVSRASGRLGSAPAPHLAPLAVPEITDLTVEEDPEEEADEPQVSVWELLKLNLPEWPLLAGGGAASFLMGATMPLFALLFAKIYGMFESSDPEEIRRESVLYAGLFAGGALASGAVTFLQAWLFHRAGARLTDRLRVMTFTNYLRQDQGWFDLSHNSVGALGARLAADAHAVQGATGSPLGALLQGVATTLFGVGLALPYSWKMTLVSLLSVPAVIGAIYLEGHVTRRSEVKEKRALERASRAATEAVLNVRTVQSLGVESAILSRYCSALGEAARGARGAARMRGPVHGLCLCAPTLGYAVSLSYGGYLIAREGMRYEYAVLVSEALIYGAWMLAEALSFAPGFAAARRSGGRIIRALRRAPDIVSEDTARDDPAWKATGEIDLSNITFRYPTRPAAPVLQDLNLHVEAGHTVALVGASGSGKSTVLQLLMRSYDPQEGTAKLDGSDIKRDLTLGSLRAQLGLVQQEPALFERSIRDNIAYGDNSREVPIDEVVLAAKQANVHNFITGLPMGYDTMLGGGGGGASLSGGQKQRVAIARALVRRPRVLLLDEATSALDASSEKLVQEALDAASKERTTLVIAHRLATVRHAHTICLVHKGVIAESGSHEELVHKRGRYWRLLQEQAGAGDNTGDGEDSTGVDGDNTGDGGGAAPGAQEL